MKRILGPVCLAILVLTQASLRADDVIAPFIDSQTNAVIHADFTNIDMDAVAAWQNKLISTITDPAARARRRRTRMRERPSAKNGFPISVTPAGKTFIWSFRSRA